jgi:hypothetical protein
MAAVVNPEEVAQVFLHFETDIVNDEVRVNMRGYSGEFVEGIVIRRKVGGTSLLCCFHIIHRSRITAYLEGAHIPCWDEFILICKS